jgi:hypothetical protein
MLGNSTRKPGLARTRANPVPPQMHDVNPKSFRDLHNLQKKCMYNLSTLERIFIRTFIDILSRADSQVAAHRTHFYCNDRPLDTHI